MPSSTGPTTSKFRRISRTLSNFLNDTSGATAIEYGLIAALLAVACIASFTALGGSSGNGWQGVANKASASMK